MPGFTQSITCESDPRVVELRQRLDSFYATTTDYTDFNLSSNDHPAVWQAIREKAREVVGQRGHARVLEFGAGRTGFARFMAEDRAKTTFTVQDITPANRAYLEKAADQVHIGPLHTVKGSFDVIFSTYVWEHVSDPQATLAHLLKLLAPGGSLVITCPRYDAPFYVPPSARHYNFVNRLKLSFWLIATRLRARLQHKPLFLIHTDPALFHKPWYRDSDAIHWVSLNDFRCSIPKGYTFRTMKLPITHFRAWVWRQFLLGFVRIDRTAA